MMSVDRIALDKQGGGSGTREALSGKEALPIRSAGIAQQCIVQHRSIALTCTAYVLPAIRELIKTVRVATELNNLKQVRSGSITSKAGSMQRVGGPVAHYACRLPSKTLLVLWQSLSVEHVALDNQGNDSEARVAPGRQGASALACRGAACSSRAQVSNRAGTQPGIHI